MSDEIMVSICCLVYNHKPYLRRCLDGFLMQKTNFVFEILIHDDASTDGSTDIIREYEKAYPSVIKPIYQTENQYSKGIKISNCFQYPRARGKYIALCEGDDYWIDENKLQKQFDILETHKDCTMCVHRVQDVSDQGETIGCYHPNEEIRSGVILPDTFLSYIEFWSFQTSSYFFVNTPELQIDRLPNFFKVTDLGDTPMMLFFATKGNVFYLDETMSCYRVAVTNGYISRIKKNSVSNRIIHLHRQINMYEEYDKYTSQKFDSFCKHMILLYQFRILQQEKSYKKMLYREYRTIFLGLTVKERIAICINAFCPHILKIYFYLKNQGK